MPEYHQQLGREKQDTVVAALRAKKGTWVGPRDYETMTPDRIYRQIEDAHDVITGELTDIDSAQVDRAAEKSMLFARTVFRCAAIQDAAEMFGGRFDSVFAVPFRTDGVDPRFSSDINAFYPIYNKDFGFTPEMQLRGVLGTPPGVIETNTQGSGQGERGATIFVPLFSTMTSDIAPDKNNAAQQAELMRIGANIMQQAGELAHKKLGAKILGLGGLFPKISGYGAMFKYHDKHDMSELVTTTGHGGTVFLLLETIKKLQETQMFKDKNVKLGVVGAAGSIGWSTTESALDLLGEFEIHANDHRMSALESKIRESGKERVVYPESSVMDVLRQSDIIVSAVTKPIDLDEIDPIDESVPISERLLSGKVIIDDSEPKAFIQSQVESRGGYLLNVAGRADDDFLALRGDGLWTGGPDTPYNFGDEAGLYDKSAWGCDVERVVVSWAGAYKEAITADVTSRDVRNIGRLCLEAGVGPAPFQINSKPVRLS